MMSTSIAKVAASWAHSICPAPQNAYGNTVAPDGSLWVADSDAFRLINVQSNGTVLHNLVVSSGSFAPEDLAVSPTDGTLWVSDGNLSSIHHLTATGVSLGTFSTFVPSHTEGIGLAPMERCGLRHRRYIFVPLRPRWNRPRCVCNRESQPNILDRRSSAGTIDDGAGGDGTDRLTCLGPATTR